MKIIGYNHPWSIRPGESVIYYISSAAKTYHAQLVKLRLMAHPNDTSNSEYTVIENEVNGAYNGYIQKLYPGSCVYFSSFIDVLSMNEWTLQFWIRPTYLSEEAKGIFCIKSLEEKNMLNLVLNGKSKKISLTIEQEYPIKITNNATINENIWYSIIIRASKTNKLLSLIILEYNPIRGTQSFNDVIKKDVDIYAGRTNDMSTAKLILGAKDYHESNGIVSSSFDGKLDSFRLFSKWIEDKELGNLDEYVLNNNVYKSNIVDLDFTKLTTRKDRIWKVACKRNPMLLGKIINYPLRFMKGAKWDSQKYPHSSREYYNAIKFHSDDIYDANWKSSFTVKTPEDLKSGVYAIQLICEDEETFLPFFVRAVDNNSNSRIAFLLPTLTYLSYANEWVDINDKTVDTISPLLNRELHEKEYNFCEKYNLPGLYNFHRDGTPFMKSSWKVPMVTTVPAQHHNRILDSVFCLSADLHISRFLEEFSYDYDVITDHDLDNYGTELLSTYTVVIIGTHSEYWTQYMQDSLLEYQNEGGRVISLSGNTMYWATITGGDDSSVMEIRRGLRGVAVGRNEPGEEYLSFTGEKAGLMRDLGRSSNHYTGSGTSAMGNSIGAAYERTNESYETTYNFIFNGINERVIGDYPAKCCRHGAASYEIDRTDKLLGTPNNAVILATSRQLDNNYQAVTEDLLIPTGQDGGEDNPDVRSEMIFYKTKKGGAVFSVGSVGWSSVLPHNNYQNNIAKILQNVIDHFIKPHSFNT